MKPPIQDSPPLPHQPSRPPGTRSRSRSGVTCGERPLPGADCQAGLSPLQRDPEPAAPSRGGSMGRKLPQTQDSHPKQEVEWGRGETAPWDSGGFGVVKRRRGCTGVRWVGPDPAKRTQTAEGLGGLPSCLILRKSSRPRLPPRGGETPRRDRKMVGCMWTQRQEPQVCASSSLPP